MPSLLIVDDDPTCRMLLCKQLEALGYDIDQAGDGAEALAMMQEHAGYDLVITDLIMPNMDGRGLITAIKEQHKLLKTPIILISATEEAKELGEMLKDSGVVFMAKPLEFFAVTTTVASMLNRRPTEAMKLTPEDMATLRQTTPPKAS